VHVTEEEAASKQLLSKVEDCKGGGGGEWEWEARTGDQSKLDLLTLPTAFGKTFSKKLNNSCSRNASIMQTVDIKINILSYAVYKKICQEKGEEADKNELL